LKLESNNTVVVNSHQADNSLRIEKDDVVDTEGNPGKVLKSTSVRDHDTDLVGPIGRSELAALTCSGLNYKRLHNSMTQQASRTKLLDLFASLHARY
jgi:hypothetical protein